MIAVLKRPIELILNSLGYELRKNRSGAFGRSFPSNPFEAQYQIITELGNPNVIILDVGAYKGKTVEEYRAKFPSAVIYCFEPFPESVAVLQKKFAHDDKIHIIPKAVTDESGHRDFYINKFDATNSLLPRPSFDRRYYPKNAGPKKVIQVEATALDEFVAAQKIQKIDILKLDIQGGELNALHGARSLLHSRNIELIYTEIMFIHHYEGAPLFHEIWSFLDKFGYSLFEIYDIHRATNGQIRYGDALFVSESVRNQIINGYPEEP